LASALAAGDGVLVWDRAGGLPRWVVGDARRSGRLTRALPGVFVDTSRACDPDVRRRAALAYAAGDGALSFTSALGLWGLLDEGAATAVHVTVPRSSSIRSRAWLVVHRPRGADTNGVDAVMRRGLSVTRVERALVDAWSVLPPGRRREPVIRAVNDRITNAARIGEALASASRLKGLAELRRLTDLLAEGCRSELEIWGHDRIFTGPGMPPFARQVPIALGARTVYLDVFAEREQVDFELDGAATHGDLRQREIDLRRDAALAGRGILVVRFTHRRLLAEPAAVRSEVLSILRVRRHP
jgi:very-short-patch-repair endonuclease